MHQYIELNTAIKNYLHSNSEENKKQHYQTIPKKIKNESCVIYTQFFFNVKYL